MNGMQVGQCRRQQNLITAFGPLDSGLNIVLGSEECSGPNVGIEFIKFVM